MVARLGLADLFIAGDYLDDQVWPPTLESATSLSLLLYQTRYINLDQAESSGTNLRHDRYVIFSFLQKALNLFQIVSID